MMDLISEYLIVIILLFATNISLLVRNMNLSKNKFIIFSLIYSVSIFVLSFALSSLNYQNDYVYYIPYFIFASSVLVLICVIMFLGAKLWKFDLNINVNNKILFGCIVLSSYLSIISLSIGLKTADNFMFSLELFALSIVVMLLIYKISKIFKRAKRSFAGVIGEYMFLEFVFTLILALTFTSVRELDYSMFKSFLILTPTYKLLYGVVIITFILVLGVLYNEHILKKLKRKH